ncbi:MAG TPA: indole-3-glycerol phosphate synthase TrpC [Candidatus Polarisedimenticolia bacterium]|nr:indole-3-glycerol phosphate synthase TrpC [Candidatus Polarisedimenticolia bacterium]
MADFLSTIARERRERLDREALHRPTLELRREAEARRGDGRPFIASLRRPSGEPLRVIAEIKRASPSAGVLKEEFDPAAIGVEYERVGAAAISVLTEPLRFQGSIEHLRQVREAVTLPVLLKDFVVHERQLFEARAHGADAALLIVSLLGPTQLKDYAALAREIGLELLIEIHEKGEVDRALELDGAIGVNNRNLKTLDMRKHHASGILPLIPADRVRIAESGYSAREEMRELERVGADGVLIGETLLKAESIEEAFAALFGAVSEKKPTGKKAG